MVRATLYVLMKPIEKEVKSEIESADYYYGSPRLKPRAKKVNLKERR
jgi:hypothetical protein